MSGIIERFTIGADEAAVAAIEKVRGATHLKSNADVTRAGLAVIYDLVVAEERGYEVILRSVDTGEVWRYSPHRPSMAIRAENDNVVMGKFPKKKTVSGHKTKGKMLAPVG